MAIPFAVDARDPLPLYAQLERSIKAAINGGRLKPGEQLPTVRQLAVDLKINANTVARVYAELEAQEILATRRGVGTFVKTVPGSASAGGVKRAAELGELSQRFLAEAAARGFSAEEVLLQLQRLTHGRKEKSDARRQTQ